MGKWKWNPDKSGTCHSTTTIPENKWQAIKPEDVVVMQHQVCGYDAATKATVLYIKKEAIDFHNLIYRSAAITSYRGKWDKDEDTSQCIIIDTKKFGLNKNDEIVKDGEDFMICAIIPNFYPNDYDRGMFYIDRDVKITQDSRNYALCMPLNQQVPSVVPERWHSGNTTFYDSWKELEEQINKKKLASLKGLETKRQNEIDSYEHGIESLCMSIEPLEVVSINVKKPSFDVKVGDTITYNVALTDEDGQDKIFAASWGATYGTFAINGEDVKDCTVKEFMNIIMKTLTVQRKK